MAGQVATSRRMQVIWQAPTSEFIVVGYFDMPSGPSGIFRFSYRHPLPTKFQPFLAFPDVHQVYESPQLFPFFQNRIMSADRPEYDDHLAALGLTRDKATPFEILVRTAGESPTDAVQIVPEVEEDVDGCLSQLFLASGARHLVDAEAVIAELSRGESLRMVDDSDNNWNPQAILLSARDTVFVGWVPNYMLPMIHVLRRSNRGMTVTVVRANGPSVPWHLRLLCQLEVAAPSAT